MLKAYNVQERVSIKLPPKIIFWLGNTDSICVIDRKEESQVEVCNGLGKESLNKLDDSITSQWLETRSLV